MVKMLTHGFPNPDHGDIAVPSQYSTEDFGCFSTHYDYGYYQVLPWLKEVDNG